MLKLYSLASSSKGNCHILTDGTTSIMLDIGITSSKLNRILYDNNLSIGNIDGCFITHEHSDHCKGVEYVSKFMKIYSSDGTFMGLKKKHNIRNFVPIWQNESIKIGTLEIIGFNVRHNAYEPFGYAVKNDLGEIFVYITDTGSIDLELNFSPNMILIECNYDEEILKRNVELGIVSKFLLERMESNEGHLSVQKLKKVLNGLKMSLCQQIILCHVSSGNGREDFYKDIENITGIETKQLNSDEFVVNSINEIDFNH